MGVIWPSFVKIGARLESRSSIALQESISGGVTGEVFADGADDPDISIIWEVAVNVCQLGSSGFEGSP